MVDEGRRGSGSGSGRSGHRDDSSGRRRCRRSSCSNLVAAAKVAAAAVVVAEGGQPNFRRFAAHAVITFSQLPRRTLSWRQGALDRWESLGLEFAGREGRGLGGGERRALSISAFSTGIPEWPAFYFHADAQNHATLALRLRKQPLLVGGDAHRPFTLDMLHRNELLAFPSFGDGLSTGGLMSPLESFQPTLRPP